MKTTKKLRGGALLAALLLSLPSPWALPTAMAQSVYPLDVLAGSSKTQSGVATLVADNTLLTSSALVGQGDRWVVSAGGGRVIEAALLRQDEANDLALLQVGGLRGELLTLATEGAQQDRHIELLIPDGPVPGMVVAVQDGRARHTAPLEDGQFAAPVLNNCGELVGLSQSAKVDLFGSTFFAFLPGARLQAGGFGMAGGLDALTAFLDRNNVDYRPAEAACPPEAARIARAEAALTAADDEARAELADAKIRLQDLEAASAQRREAMNDAAAESEAQARQRLYIGIAAVVAVVVLLGVVFASSVRRKVQDMRHHNISGDAVTMRPVRHSRPPAAQQFPDILLAGTDANGNEHHLKISGSALLKAKEGQVIGRSVRDSDYTLNLEYVSRRHCLLQIRDNQVYVKDLNSANGTAVNGVNLTPQKEEDEGEGEKKKSTTITPRFREAIISDGDKLRIGLLMMRVSIEKGEGG